MAYKDKEKNRLYNKAYRESHKEKLRIQRKAYYLSHKEQENKQNRVYHYANKKQIIKRQKLYRQTNIDTRKEYWEKYQQKNAEKLKEYRQKNKGRIKENGKNWYNKNREIARDYCRQRRAKIYETRNETINDKIVFMRDGWICQICKKRVNKNLKWPHSLSASLDHIVPLIEGGAHIYSNVQLAHLVCNTSKQARVLPQGEQMRIF